MEKNTKEIKEEMEKNMVSERKINVKIGDIFITKPIDDEDDQVIIEFIKNNMSIADLEKRFLRVAEIHMLPISSFTHAIVFDDNGMAYRVEDIFIIGDVYINGCCAI